MDINTQEKNNLQYKMFGTIVLSTLLIAAVASLDIEPNGYFYESEYATNCQEIQKRSNATSGVYPIKPNFYQEPFLVYCDMENVGGGWVRIINRVDNSQNFSLPWEDYKSGFGNLNGNFWLGLERIHHLTVSEVNQLLVQLVDWDSVVYNMHYAQFSISGEESGYALQLLGSYIGDLGDSFSYHVGKKFSTIDRDNDDNPDITCSVSDGGGGWWYKSCYQSQLTGNYILEEEARAGNGVGICWIGYQEFYPSAPRSYSFKEARMMIKPVSTA